MEGDILVMNADVYCCSEILDLALDSPYDVVMLTDKSRLAVGDYFFKPHQMAALLNMARNCLYLNDLVNM